VNTPKTVKALEDLGREQLSPSFFMRDFLYSEISQIEGIPNIPEKTIHSYAPPKGCLTKPGMPNHDGSHSAEYETMLEEMHHEGSLQKTL